MPNEEILPDPMPPVIDLRGLDNGEGLDPETVAILESIVASGQSVDCIVVKSEGPIEDED